MASVVVTPTAASDLARLIDTHSLPVDTITRLVIFGYDETLDRVAIVTLQDRGAAGRWQEEP